MHKSVPKVPKVLTFGKVYQKIQKSGGGVRPVLDEVQIKAAFYFQEAPLLLNDTKVTTDHQKFPKFGPKKEEKKAFRLKGQKGPQPKPSAGARRRPLLQARHLVIINC